jgi:3-oxoacyl-[acyl-carrier-protein] synthase-1
VAPISQWDASRWPVRIAAEVRAESKTLVADRKLYKIITRTDLFGLSAADSAVQQSGLLAYRDSLGVEAAAQFNDRSGVFAGSGGGAYRSNYEFFPLMTTAGGNLEIFGREVGSSVNPMWLLKHLPNNVLCHTGIRLGFKGTNGCITNQCVGGALAVTEAAAAIRAGEADRAAAIGHDAPIEPETVLHYQRLGLLAQEAVRPFDRDRDGTVLGEGAAALILESESSARSRGAKVLGEFLGSGCVTEGTGILDVRPDGDGVARAVRLALAEASLSVDDIGMIVVHGNGTRASDASEAAGVHAVFGDRIPPMTGFKWACGHLISGSGILDLVLALTALQRGTVPGVATLKELDPELSPLPLSRSLQKPRSDVVLVVCRGFGGMNVALIVRARTDVAG